MPVLVSAYNAVKQTLTGMVRLFYPSLCAACGKDLPWKIALSLCLRIFVFHKKFKGAELVART